MATSRGKKRKRKKKIKNAVSHQKLEEKKEDVAVEPPEGPRL